MAATRRPVTTNQPAASNASAASRHSGSSLNVHAAGNAPGIVVNAQPEAPHHRPNSHVALKSNNGRSIGQNVRSAPRPTRATDEHLAMVFGGIVTAFFVCHAPRMVLVSLLLNYLSMYFYNYFQLKS